MLASPQAVWHRLKTFLFTRTDPVYGKLTLNIVLLLTLYYTLYAHISDGSGVREHHLSVLGFLPDEWLFNPAIHLLLKAVILTGALLWLQQAWLPWSGWLTTLAYTALIAMTQESQHYTDHVFHFVNHFLWIYCAWYHLYRREIAAALAEKRFFQTQLFPQWVYGLSLFYITAVYTMAGLNKWFASGWDWANGLSLQLWILDHGDSGTLAGRLMLYDRTFAWTAQWLTLLAETLAVAALFAKSLRIAVGTLLLGCHIFIQIIFPYNFYGNVLLLFLVMYPALSRAIAVRIFKKAGAS